MEMEFACLLVSQDPKLCGVIDAVLRNFSIKVDHCLTSSKAAEAITKATHDLVVIDWEENASSELVQTIWRQQKHKPTLLAISADVPSSPGVHFRLRKPVTIESGTESMRAAYSRMLLEYRLNARFAVMTQTSAQDENGQSFAVTITDIGDSGVGLRSKHKFAVGSMLSFSTRLPGTLTDLHIQARVVWARDGGTAGCKIMLIPPVDREILRDWLKSRIRVKKPIVPSAD